MRMLIAAVSTGLLLTGACHAAGEPGFLVHAGEWQNSIETAPGPPPHVTLTCEKTDKVMNASTMGAMMGHMAAHCGTPVMSDDGSTMTLVMSCDIGGGKLTTNSVITRDGPDAIATHTISHMAGGSFQMPDMNMVTHARRLGPCQPGDRAEPDLSGGGRH